MLKRLLLLCLSSFAFFYASQSVAASYPWNTGQAAGASSDGVYHYYFQQETLQEALARFAQSYELDIYFSPKLTDNELTKTVVSGRFEVKNPTDFLNILSKNYDFKWFYYSGVLYITSSQMTTQSASVSPDYLSSIHNILLGEGLLDDRFSYSEVPGEGLIVVSGPTEYVQKIISRITEFNISPVGQQFAVFRLKYANASDTTVTFNNKQITVPGVATILKSVLQGSKNASTDYNSKLLDTVTEPLKNNPMAQELLKKATEATAGNTSSVNANSESKDFSTGPDHKPNLSSPLIQADERLNTIIIRDKAANIEIYRSLIALLDVAAPVIQVDVMVIDVDENKLNSAGVNWWGQTNNSSSSKVVSGGFGGNNLSSSTSASATPSVIAAYGDINPANLIVSNVSGFFTSLEFLSQTGTAKTNAKSAVVTIDNLAAYLNMTETFYINVATAGSSGSSSQQSTTTTVAVTPHVIYDDQGNKKIKLTVSLSDGSLEDKMVNSMPTTLQGSINSQAVIDEGNGLLIGGYAHSQIETAQSKVPILGDIPFLGWLFKTENKQERHYQRSYLVTPKILWAKQMESYEKVSMSPGSLVSPVSPEHTPAQPDATLPDSNVVPVIDMDKKPQLPAPTTPSPVQKTQPSAPTVKKTPSSPQQPSVEDVLDSP